jgi:hypothetical protein
MNANYTHQAKRNLHNPRFFSGKKHYRRSRPVSHYALLTIPFALIKPAVVYGSIKSPANIRLGYTVFECGRIELYGKVHDLTIPPYLADAQSARPTPKKNAPQPKAGGANNSRWEVLPAKATRHPQGNASPDVRRLHIPLRRQLAYCRG